MSEICSNCGTNEGIGCSNHSLAPVVSETGVQDRFSLEVYQQDWVPGFTAFMDDGELRESAKAHLMINVGGFLATVESGELTAKDLPYLIAESLMHEAIHALEAWAKVEFSEEKVEELLQKYRKQYRPTDEKHWYYDPEAKRDNSNQFERNIGLDSTSVPKQTELNACHAATSVLTEEQAKFVSKKYRPIPDCCRALAESVELTLRLGFGKPDSRTNTWEKRVEVVAGALRSYEKRIRNDYEERAEASHPQDERERLKVEYDDGVPDNESTRKHKPAAKGVTRRDRKRGFYFGVLRIPVEYMRVSEMAAFDEFTSHTESS